MYATRRHGRINANLAKAIWRILKPLYLSAAAGHLPACQNQYDTMVITSALKIGRVLQKNMRGGFGIGQKIVNLMMKDLWALGVIKPPIENLLHAPVDRIVLGKFSKVPSLWKSWTSVVATTKNAPEIREYLQIQADLRHHWATFGTVFSSVIEMEQFIWQRIP